MKEAILTYEELLSWKPPPYILTSNILISNWERAKLIQWLKAHGFDLTREIKMIEDPITNCKIFRQEE